MQRLERVRHQAVVDPPPPPAGGDEAGPAEHAQVVGEQVGGDLHLAQQLADAVLAAVVQAGEDPQAEGIGQGTETGRPRFNRDRINDP